MAPELGLFLDECFFAAYNAQFGKLHEELALEPYADKVAAFKVGGGACTEGRERPGAGAAEQAQPLPPPLPPPRGRPSCCTPTSRGGTGRSR